MKTHENKVILSAGAQQLAQFGKAHGWKALAARCACSESQLRFVAKGARSPSPALRASLLEHAGVPVHTWGPGAVAGLGETTATGATPASVPPAPASPGASAAGLGTTAAEVEANVLRLREQAVAASTDPLCSHRDRATVAAALNAGLRHLSRLRGEEDVSRARLLASREWNELRTLIGRTLAADEYGAARRALLAALADFSAGASS